MFFASFFLQSYIVKDCQGFFFFLYCLPIKQLLNPLPQILKNLLPFFLQKHQILQLFQYLELLLLFLFLQVRRHPQAQHQTHYQYIDNGHSNSHLIKFSIVNDNSVIIIIIVTPNTIIVKTRRSESKLIFLVVKSIICFVLVISKYYIFIYTIKKVIVFKIIVKS